ncbi:UNVERIFIED_ORG: hypothetical protein LHK14_17970 [Roseateles sp. XES5]|nr:hypothetical protein [Roseateles sp. XES5]
MRLLRFAGRCMRSIGRFTAAVVPPLFREAIGIAGAGIFVYGFWQIFAPAGFIVGGILLMAAAIIMARSRA